MLCALTVRTLKPGKYDEFMEAFVPGDEDARRLPEGWKRFYALRNVGDENEVITFGFFDGSLEELRASQQQGVDGETYEEARASIDHLVESVGADAIYEVVEDRPAG